MPTSTSRRATSIPVPAPTKPSPSRWPPPRRPTPRSLRKRERSFWECRSDFAVGPLPLRIENPPKEALSWASARLPQPASCFLIYTDLQDERVLHLRLHPPRKQDRHF